MPGVEAGYEETSEAEGEPMPDAEIAEIEDIKIEEVDEQNEAEDLARQDEEEPEAETEATSSDESENNSDIDDHPDAGTVEIPDEEEYHPDAMTPSVQQLYNL